MIRHLRVAAVLHGFLLAAFASCQFITETYRPPNMVWYIGIWLSPPGPAPWELTTYEIRLTGWSQVAGPCQLYEYTSSSAHFAAPSHLYGKVSFPKFIAIRKAKDGNPDNTSQYVPVAADFRTPPEAAGTPNLDPNAPKNAPNSAEKPYRDGLYDPSRPGDGFTFLVQANGTVALGYRPEGIATGEGPLDVNSFYITLTGPDGKEKKVRLEITDLGDNKYRYTLVAPVKVPVAGVGGNLQSAATVTYEVGGVVKAYTHKLIEPSYTTRDYLKVKIKSPRVPSLPMPGRERTVTLGGVRG